ncbi:MAG: hypothetical protein E7166_06540 [Firmicutes bacterium]|nr:hypothetical protein [Bacillota bacterium]
MYKYESRYRYKGASVYGEPYIKIINKICEDNKKGFSILIPNCLDGIDVLPFLMRGAKVDCFEETKELIDGGVINKFKSVGLKNRIKGINCADKCNIFLSNFYSSKINKKYDVVFVSRTLHYKSNNFISLKNKINKLKSCVKDGGYLYIKYYLNNNKRQYFKKNEILNMFDSEDWDIIFYRENYDREISHSPHPYNSKKHYHKVGYIYLRKITHNKSLRHKKRKLNRVYRTGSVFGIPLKQIGQYKDYILSINDNPRVLLVDCNDGLNVLQFAKSNYEVCCYETDKVLLNGGIIDGYKTDGLYKRLKDYNLLDNVNIKNCNYYEIKEPKKYDFVLCDRTLHYERNGEITLKKKVRKLMSSVKEGGYLYIYYYLAINEDDYITYPINQYFRKDEMQPIFDLEDWEIVYLCERNKTTPHHSHPMNNKKHSHKTGYILAKKKRNRRKYKYNFEISINTEI